MPFDIASTKVSATIPSIAERPKTMLLPNLFRKLMRTKPSLDVKGTDTARGFEVSLALVWRVETVDSSDL